MEILDTKGGNQFFKFDVGKKKGESKFFQNPRGEPKPYTLWQYFSKKLTSALLADR